MANKQRKRCGNRNKKSALKNVVKQKITIDRGQFSPGGSANATINGTLLDDIQSVTKANDYVQKNRKKSSRNLTGRRILSIDALKTLVLKTQDHARQCRRSDLEIAKETWVGLRSRFHLTCKYCGDEISISSDSTNSSLSINEAAVWGNLEGGSGYESFFDLLKIMDIPPMNFRRYKTTEIVIHRYQEKSLAENLIENGKEELRLALEDKDTMYINGVPCINVSCDGGWGKRSYGHSFKSLSGCAVIIGNKTGKILFVGVRNKYCHVCDVFPESPHTCFKNYCGSSTAMETDVIVEGFLRSKDMHGIYYNKMLADQDSSVFVNVKEAMKMKYGVTVEKINCVNHAVRCLKTNLYKMAAQTKTYKEKSRSWLKANIMKFGTAIRCAIGYNHVNSSKDSNWQTLRQDILNSPEHYVGNHEKCRKYFCKKETDVITIIKDDSSFWKDLNVIFNRLANLSQSLIQNQRTNQAESFMGIVSKYICGKRKNYYLRNQYQTRVYFAANSHKKMHLGPKLNYKLLFSKSPLSFWSLKGLRHKGRRPRDRKYKTDNQKAATEKDYGDKAQSEDMSSEILKIESEKYLEMKSLTLEKQQQLMKATTGQSGNQKWFDIRSEILTSSKFYEVVRKHKKTKIGNLVKSILHSKYTIAKQNNVNFINDARCYGLYYENEARKKYEEIYNKTVTETGIIVDSPKGLLGASPDGLIESDGLLEIKCPYSARFYDDINNAIQEGVISYLRLIDGKIQLVRNSNYYFQIIGQLGISNRDYCDFFVFVPNAKTNSYYCERIVKNPEMWNLMKPELERFYIVCILPEIIDPRLSRKMNIREFDFVVSNPLQMFRKSLGPGVSNNIARKRKASNFFPTTPKKKPKQLQGKILFDG